MIGNVLGTKQEGDTTLHRVPASVPGWALCGTYCITHPKLSAQASPKFCAPCAFIEKKAEDAAPAEEDPRGDDGPYSYVADAYMRQP
jgi:hypothetical protein